MLQNIKQIKLVELSGIISKFQFVIIDKKVSDLYKAQFEIDNQKIIEVENPESQKTIEGWSHLQNLLLEKSITRNDKILVVGGGALSDLAGFVASTILRGVNWSVVPTTLLSMVDASIGGKVGINHEKGKNLVGAFYQPENIYISTEFLNTLDSSEFQSGLGEIFKYGILSDQIYQMIIHDASLDSIIQACALYKKRIVEEDFKEGARRKILNLGHTLGHAFEKMEKISHGIAVSIGIQAITMVTNPYLILKISALIAKMKIEIPELKNFEFEKFWNFVLMDKKKVSTDFLEIIVPLDIGQVVLKKVNLNEFERSIRENEFFKNYK